MFECSIWENTDFSLPVVEMGNENRLATTVDVAVYWTIFPRL